MARCMLAAWFVFSNAALLFATSGRSTMVVATKSRQLRRTSVSGGVDHVDFGILVRDCSVLRKNCDSTLLLQRVRVHDSLIMLLIRAEYA